jgi:hypothetical protein
MRFMIVGPVFQSPGSLTGSQKTLTFSAKCEELNNPISRYYVIWL